MSVNIFENLNKQRILPVTGLPDCSNAVQIAGAILSGGIRSLEITARFDGWTDAISDIRLHIPGICVGAGTILNVDLAQKAIEAGAEFLVSPGYSDDVRTFAAEHDIAWIPGCATSTEIMAAYNAGIEVVKFFPAEALGGVAALKLLSGAFGKMRFLPTGGMNFDNLHDYLALESVIAVGGSFMSPKDAVLSCDVSRIKRLCAKSLEYLP